MTIETLRKNSFDTVENWFWNGQISQELWDQYRCEWRTGAYRFSSVAATANCAHCGEAHL